MKAFGCVIARTAHEIADAQRLRWRVYGDEEGMLSPSACAGGREIDAADDLPETLHFLVYAHGQAAGTVRLLRGDRDPGNHAGGRLGLDLDAKLDLSSLCAPGIVAAEVTRFCVLRRYRCTGVAAELFRALRAESLRVGITHWVAAANLETDVAEDAALAYRLAAVRRWLEPRWSAPPRISGAPALDRGREHGRGRPIYTDEERRRAAAGQLAGLAPPRTVSLFATRMGARFIGAPIYDAYFRVFALPLVASLRPTAYSAPAPQATSSPSVVAVSCGMSEGTHVSGE